MNASSISGSRPIILERLCHSHVFWCKPSKIGKAARMQIYARPRFWSGTGTLQKRPRKVNKLQSMLRLLDIHESLFRWQELTFSPLWFATGSQQYVKYSAHGLLQVLYGYGTKISSFWLAIYGQDVCHHAPHERTSPCPPHFPTAQRPRDRNSMVRSIVRPLNRQL